MTSGPGELILTVNCCELVTGVGALSVAVTVNEKEPVAVGVPVSGPSMPTVKPGGSVPLVTAQVNGGEPPLDTANP